MCRVLCIFVQKWYFNCAAFWHKKLYNCSNKNSVSLFVPLCCRKMKLHQKVSIESDKRIIFSEIISFCFIKTLKDQKAPTNKRFPSHASKKQIILCVEWLISFSQENLSGMIHFHFICINNYYINAIHVLRIKVLKFT